MELSELKKSVWGYNKDSVCRYLVSLEEEMSAKLEEKDREAARTEERLRARIAELEKSLEESQKELLQMTETQETVKKETDTKEEEFEKILAGREQYAMQEIRAYADEQTKKAENYAANVGRLRRYCQQMLENLDREAAGLETEIERLEKDKPVFEPKLFRRKPVKTEMGE